MPNQHIDYTKSPNSIQNSLSNGDVENDVRRVEWI